MLSQRSANSAIDRPSFRQDSEIVQPLCARSDSPAFARLLSRGEPVAETSHGFYDHDAFSRHRIPRECDPRDVGIDHRHHEHGHACGMTPGVRSDTRTGR